MKASVVVAAYNAEKTIRSCLEALLNQSLPRDQYEIIVVDDGSTDSTPDIVKIYDVKLFKQDNQGPAIARNLGVEKASSEIVLFTDSDCEPDYYWLEKMCKPFQDREIIGAKGFYRTRQKNTAAKFAQIEYEDKYDFMNRDKYIDFIDTYSAAYRRDVFLENGGFDSIYTTASGEDSELSYRLALKGYKMVAAPSAIVYHKHPDTLLKYLKKKFRNAYWRAVTWKMHPQKIVKDSHTPNTLKFQVALCGLIMIFAIGCFVHHYLAYAFFSSVVLFFLTTLPFTFKALKKNAIIGIFSPAFLFLRAIAFVFGVATRIIFSMIAKFRRVKNFNLIFS